jgi:N-sulfoglucosamine sulfohydrolase
MLKSIFILFGLALLAFDTPHLPTADAPNILFLIADDAGLDFGAYGSSYSQTPGFDRIAKEGVLFENAYTPNAKCAPSRSCILTGRNSWQLEAAANHWVYFPPQFKTFPEALAAFGYEIAFTGKGYSPGKALNHAGKPRNLIGPNCDTFLLQAPTTEISRIDYTANFKHFLNRQVKGKPWFFWVGFNEPHRACEYGTGVRLGGKKTSDIAKVPAYWPDTDTIRNDLLDYAYELAYMDGHVQRILQALEDSGQLENTLVVMTSDHGMPFPRVKGNQYEHANHIPLAMMWKKGIKKPGRKVRDYVSFIDLAPSFLNISGIDPAKSGMHPITGKSLLNILKSESNGQIEAARNFVLVGQERHDFGRPQDQGYPIRGIHKNGILYLKNHEPERWPACNPETGYLNCDGGATKTYILNQRRNGLEKKYWKLNFGHRPAEELYDVRKDPDCVINLAGKTEYRVLMAKLRIEMETKLKAQGDLRMLGYGHLYEQFPGAEVNGFYERFMQGEKIKTTWVSPTDFEKGPVLDY